MRMVLLKTLIYARLSITGDQRLSFAINSQLPARDAWEQLERDAAIEDTVGEGGGGAEGRTLKVICILAVLEKLLASIIFNWPGAQETVNLFVESWIRFPPRCCVESTRIRLQLFLCFPGFVGQFVEEGGYGEVWWNTSWIRFSSLC